nr:hypothetical protein [Actinomycetota bacterium]
MRTFLSFVPALVCVGAMVACARMAMKHAPDRSQNRVPDPLASETGAHDG